jgi:hypothetical protein
VGAEPGQHVSGRADDELGRRAGGSAAGWDGGLWLAAVSGWLADWGALGAIPVTTAGDVLQFAVWAKTSGLSANGLLRLYASEYDVNGTQLRQTLVTTLGGNQAAWVQITGSVATGASTVYADLLLRVVDTITPGESANATVWFDNVQVWDQTLTGAPNVAATPYCELRFPQSPAQLIVSGLVGDLPAPALVALGTYIASLATGTALNWALGRRGQASANGLMVGVPVGFQTPNTGSSVPTILAALDAASYGGYYLSTTLGNGFNPRGFSFAAADMLGVYHLFSRAWTAEVGGNLANVSTRLVTQQRSQAWFGAANGGGHAGLVQWAVERADLGGLDLDSGGLRAGECAGVPGGGAGGSHAELPDAAVAVARPDRRRWRVPRQVAGADPGGWVAAAGAAEQPIEQHVRALWLGVAVYRRIADDAGRAG